MLLAVQFAHPIEHIEQVLLKLLKPTGQEQLLLDRMALATHFEQPVQVQQVHKFGHKLQLALKKYELSKHLQTAPLI